MKLFSLMDSTPSFYHTSPPQKHAISLMFVFTHQKLPQPPPYKKTDPWGNTTPLPHYPPFTPSRIPLTLHPSPQDTPSPTRHNLRFTVNIAHTTLYLLPHVYPLWGGLRPQGATWVALGGCYTQKGYLNTLDIIRILGFWVSGTP